MKEGAYTIRRTVQYGAKQLAAHGVDNAENDSFLLLSDLMGLDRTQYFVNGEREVEAKVLAQFQERLDRRCAHEPLQHILGKAWFYGRAFAVSKDVLVPRPDTEILVEQAICLLQGGQNKQVLDLCTGSGCIGITIAMELKEESVQVVAADLSKEALAVAERNRQLLGASNVMLVQSDLFEAMNVYAQEEKQFDMIVSNPPYIETGEIAALSVEVREYDPIMALDGHEDGLYFYRKITEEAGRYLKKGGRLLYEIGSKQGKAVSDFMEKAGFSDVQIIKDYAGLDRVVRGRL